jgi:hypothetical protein
MAKAGRKRFFDEQQKELFIRLVEFGFYENIACDLLGVNNSTLTREKKRDADFAAKIHNAQLGALTSVLSKLFVNINAGNQRAIEYFLNNRFPKLFNSRGINYAELGSDDNIKIKVEIVD